MLVRHQVRPRAAKMALGGLKLEGLGDIGVVLRAAECGATLLWHVSFGWHAVLRDCGRAASITASLLATTLLSWTRRWGNCSCRTVASRRGSQSEWRFSLVPTSWLVQPLYLRPRGEVTTIIARVVFPGSIVQAAGNTSFAPPRLLSDEHLVSQSSKMATFSDVML